MPMKYSPRPRLPEANAAWANVAWAKAALTEGNQPLAKN
jgi:hypothetical protein